MLIYSPLVKASFLFDNFGHHIHKQIYIPTCTYITKQVLLSTYHILGIIPRVTTSMRTNSFVLDSSRCSINVCVLCIIMKLRKKV